MSVKFIKCTRTRAGVSTDLRIPIYVGEDFAVSAGKGHTAAEFVTYCGGPYNTYMIRQEDSANINSMLDHFGMKDYVKNIGEGYGDPPLITGGDVLTFDAHRKIHVSNNPGNMNLRLDYYYDNNDLNWPLVFGGWATNSVIVGRGFPWVYKTAKIGNVNINIYYQYDELVFGFGTDSQSDSAYQNLRTWFEGAPEPFEPDPDPNADKWGNSTPGGGKGTRPGDSGKIVNPYSPSVDALDAGFMTAFLPTASQLNDLATYLWNNPISFESLEKLISNPFDLIIGLHMLPISISSTGTKAIKPGALTSGISAAYTDKQIVTKDFGTLTIAERWGSVLDYAPYTKISIHLPYIGTRTLDTDEVMGKTIGLKYKVDILSGACVAEISVDGSVMYEFAGNMALDIPITAQDHRQLLATLATIGVTAAGAGLAALGGAGAVAGAGAAASEAAGATGITAATVAQVGNAAVGVVMAAKPTIERAGGLGSAAGWCGVQTPYILIESPEQSLPKDYMSFNGYPCNMTFTLSDLTGYTQCETVRFGSAHATDPETQEVIASLQAGVVLGGNAPTKPSDPAEGIGVTLYQNASPALYVYKNITAYGAQHVCSFKQPTDIVTPTITLELSAIDFNYVYIGGSVNRYYYVTEKRSVRRGVWEVELRCDVLMSFAADILAASAVVSRQENEWNMYLDDGTFKAYQYTNFYQEPFGTSFDTSTYVLIVAGS